MSQFKYTKKEQNLNRVLKYNQKSSLQLLNDEVLSDTRKNVDQNISSAEELLASLGYEDQVTQARKRSQVVDCTLEHRPQMNDWNTIVDEATKMVPNEVTIEDLLSPEEIESAFQELETINSEFSRKTSIVNKVDLSFLAVATGLQVVKALIFPYVAKQFGYGDSFDPASRLVHNDRSIEQAHKEANDKFRDKHIEKHEQGHWINLLYQTPPYDITKGSAALGINMEGRYHRLHTLGHDPILGWLFGTANILTDIVTMNDFRSFRVTRKPTMVITPNMVGIGTMLYESYQAVKDDYLSLPAAIFAQAQHLKSDVNTKTGLPVPILSSFNENFAGNLYKSQYDVLCLARDVKIVGASYTVSLFIDAIITLIHGLYRQNDEPQDMYEVRTRKILILSNMIASTSSVIQTCITQNPKNLDIGSVLATLTHLFTDIRFITRIKQEFIQKEIDRKLQAEFAEIDYLYNVI